MNNRNVGIQTFQRFIYLNSYAFLLLTIGGCIAFLPLYSIGGWWLTIPQLALAFYCLKGAYKIFRSWNDKKRKYQILIERNTPSLRPDTFKEFMQAPCGRLLTKVVLTDLGQPEAYCYLKEQKLPLVKRLRLMCKPQKTIIHNSNI